MRQYAYYKQTPQMALDIAPPLSAHEALMRASRGLPTGEAALFEEARAVIRRFAAAMDRDPTDIAAHNVAESRIEAIGFRLAYPAMQEFNIGTVVRSEVWERLFEAVKATDGTVPIWGQPGRFVVTAECRVFCEVHGLLGSGLNHLHCTAIDLDRPFISSTGFLYAYPQLPREPKSVEAWVIETINKQRESWNGYGKPPRIKKLVPISARYRTEAERGDDPAWQPGGWLHELAQNPPAKQKRQRKPRAEQ